MTGTVTINGVIYQVGISDLTPADVLPVFRTDTSILKTDSILLHAAGAQQNSAKKVLIPHLISLMSSAVAEDVVLTIEPYYDANGEYQGMYWHYNGQWLRRSDTGEMISVTDDAAEIALAAEQAVEATIAAKAATTAATNTESRVSAAEELRVQAENQRKSNEQQRQGQETTRQNQEQTRQQNETTRQTQESTRQSQEQTRQQNEATRNTQESTRQNQEQTRQQNEQTRQNQEQARVAAERQRTTTFQQDHERSVTATQEAEQVNAELDGMTVTITNREGTSRSVDLSFDFYASYPSVAAMNADIANIPLCALVSIATDDPLDDENARVYQRRTDGTLKYICDLDQKSAEAWNDWLENKKPEIQQRIDTADADHTMAEGDHSTADADHTRAESDHTRAESDHTRAESDHSTATDDHANYTADRQTFAENEAQRQQDFEDAEEARMAAMVVTRCFVDLTTMCLMFVQPASDGTQYQVRNGNLNITVTYNI